MTSQQILSLYPPRWFWALIMLLVCLAGIVVQISYSLFLSNGIEVFGTEGIVMPVLVFVIAVLLTWFAHHSKEKGWIA